MSDIADSAEARINLDLEYAMKNIDRAPEIEPDMHCLFCDEAVAIEKLFCNKDCRDDYEKLIRLKKIGGAYN